MLIQRTDRVVLARFAARVGVTVLVFFGFMVLVESLNAARFEHTPTERQGVDMLPAVADDMRFEVSDFAVDGPPSGLPPAAAHSGLAQESARAAAITPFPGLSHGEVPPTTYDLDPEPLRTPAHEPAYPTIPEPAHESAHELAYAAEPEVAELPSIPAVPRAEEVTPSGMAPSIDFDFGDLSLDLDAPPPKPAAETGTHGSEFSLSGTEAVPELELPSLDTNEPMARKIELADEFRRIGDHEGARELLGEVLAKGEGPLRSRAQTLLDALG